jgi:hypothetical protein
MVLPVLYVLAGMALVLIPAGFGLALSRMHGPGEVGVAPAEPAELALNSDLEFRFTQIELALTRVEQKVELLPQTWEAFRDGSIKAEQRARHHARKEAALASDRAESEDVDEPSELRDGDGVGSRNGAVLAMHPTVGARPALVTEDDYIRLAARIKGLI